MGVKIMWLIQQYAELPNNAQLLLAFLVLCPVLMGIGAFVSARYYNEDESDFL